MHNAQITEKVELLQGVTATLSGNAVTLKGPKGEVTRKLASKRVAITIEGSQVALTARDATKNDKRELETNAAHLRNMARGVKDGHVYKLKICSGHFPMSVSLKGDTFEVKNFIGESVPRRLKVRQGVKITIAGMDITVESHNKEWAGTQAAAIELLTRRPGFDTRVFQDGIYITEKDGKKA